MKPTVVHLCPPDEGCGCPNPFPCCGLSPFELPRSDRITLDPALVTCHKPTVEPGT